MNDKDLYNLSLLPEHLKNLPPIPDGYDYWKIHGFNNGFVYPIIKNIKTPWNIVLLCEDQSFSEDWCENAEYSVTGVPENSVAFYIIAEKKLKKKVSQPIKTKKDLRAEISRLKKKVKTLEKIKKLLCENS